ncbi:MAG TPA: hypothetical protein VF748_00460 [Candidatus Acidoferrum sp.]
MRVILLYREKKIAWYVAKLRDEGEWTRSNTNRKNHNMNTRVLHYIGCLGEMAFAKGMDKYWSGAGRGAEDDDDVGGLQVRVTRHLNGRLPIYLEDDDNKPFFLLIGEKGEYRVAGWAFAYEAKHDKYWKKLRPDKPAAWYYPQHLLRPLTDLTYETPPARFSNGSSWIRTQN